MQGLIQDLRFSWRQLLKSPGFTLIAVAVLGLGIGASTAIFSAVNPILFEPLPYLHSGRIMMIWYGGKGGTRAPQAFHNYREVAGRSRSYENLSVMKAWTPALTGGGLPERLDGQQVTADYFRTLAVEPVLGRDFQNSDDTLNGPKVAILSHGLWRRRFGADRTILGRDVRLDDNAYTVIGVMPESFENVLAPTAEIWSPLQYDAANIASPLTREWGHHLRMVARLRAGVTEDQAQSELAAIAKNPVSEFPRPRGSSLEDGFVSASLQDDVARGIKPALLAVFGAVFLLLLIACVNVTNLLLERGAQRRPELAMRTALGAARSRLIRQLITESLLLALLGAVLGMLIAQAGVRALILMSPAELPRLHAISVNGQVFAFAFAMTMLVGFGVGLIPALYSSGGELRAGMDESSRRTTGGHQGVRRALVVAEVSIALSLLIGAGLMLHSLRRLLSVPPGFDHTRLLTMQVQTFGRRYDDDAVCHRFFEQALNAVRDVPGVQAAAFTSQLPLSGDSDVYGARFEGDGPDVGYAAFRYAVSPGYFEAMGIPLVRGRFIDARELASGPKVAVISEALAQRKFRGQDPLGKRFHMGGAPDSPLFTIVGVVGDVRQTSLAITDAEAVYVRSTQWHWADGTQSLVVRTHGDAAALAPLIKRAIWSVDRDQPIVRVETMEDLVVASAAERHFVLILFEAFGFVALLLAATGIYGVLSGSVTERIREIGVRLALGAPRASILAMVMRQGMIVTAFGVVIGVVVAIAASRLLVSLLFGISPLDPLTYVGVVVILTIVAGVACWVPAWRAARLDPMVALRYE
jgi:putative ABC transport system permease protein